MVKYHNTNGGIIMRNLVWAFALALTLLVLAPDFSSAEGNLSKKQYGIEFQIGGGYYDMGDVNNFAPDQGFVDPLTKGTANDKINIGTQIGVGFLYRNMENFGWVFGWNKLMAGIPSIMDEKYRTNAYFTATESWAEQTITGNELYILPTWYFNLGDDDDEDGDGIELNLSIGPAFYTASLDRSISIIRSEGSGANPAGSFEDAKGTSLGLILMGGVELPISDNGYISAQIGGRLANVGKLNYEDQYGVEQPVLKNSSSNAYLGANFSGVFLKLTLRTYFAPDKTWRSPKR